MKRIRLLKLFRGDISQHTLMRYFVPANLGISLFFLLLSYLLEPLNLSYPYNWTTSTISRLGWPHENVVGWIFFSLAFIFLGILTLPLVSYYYRKFGTLNKRWARVLSLMLFLACIGLFLLGTIPNFNTDKIFFITHMVNAFLSFISLYAMSIIICVIIIRNKTQGIASRKFVITYIIMFVYGFLAFILMVLVNPQKGISYYVHDPATPLLLSIPFWEWQTFLIALFLGMAPIYMSFKQPGTR
jgi:hypothetical protein